jgi:hypothetical protein
MEERHFMFASPDCTAASTPLTNMSEAWHAARAANSESKVAFAALFRRPRGMPDASSCHLFHEFWPRIDRATESRAPNARRSPPAR